MLVLETGLVRLFVKGKGKLFGKAGWMQALHSAKMGGLVKKKLKLLAMEFAAGLGTGLGCLLARRMEWVVMAPTLLAEEKRTIHQRV